MKRMPFLALGVSVLALATTACDDGNSPPVSDATVSPAPGGNEPRPDDGAPIENVPSE